MRVFSRISVTEDETHRGKCWQLRSPSRSPGTQHTVVSVNLQLPTRTFPKATGSGGSTKGAVTEVPWDSMFDGVNLSRHLGGGYRGFPHREVVELEVVEFRKHMDEEEGS
jgi:hypothetical protein